MFPCRMWLGTCIAKPNVSFWPLLNAYEQGTRLDSRICLYPTKMIQSADRRMSLTDRMCRSPNVLTSSRDSTQSSSPQPEEVSTSSTGVPPRGDDSQGCCLPALLQPYLLLILPYKACKGSAGQETPCQSLQHKHHLVAGGRSRSDVLILMHLKQD